MGAFGDRWPGEVLDGGDIIPRLVKAGAAQVYDFARNEVPGSADRERFTVTAGGVRVIGKNQVVKD